MSIFFSCMATPEIKRLKKEAMRLRSVVSSQKTTEPIADPERREVYESPFRFSPESLERDFSRRWDENLLSQRKMAFRVSIGVTLVSYAIVVMLIVTNAFDFGGAFPWIHPVELGIEKLTLFITGFLAQILLLPKIVYQEIFKSRQNITPSFRGGGNISRPSRPN